ncbi:MAG: hypothetical protein ACREPH_07150 [Rhodanobacteraceae bacterium]
MQRPLPNHGKDTDTGFANRCISAFVAVLFFAPPLALLRLLGDRTFAWGDTLSIPVGLLRDRLFITILVPALHYFCAIDPCCKPKPLS